MFLCLYYKTNPQCFRCHIHLNQNLPSKYSIFFYFCLYFVSTFASTFIFSPKIFRYLPIFSILCSKTQLIERMQGRLFFRICNFDIYSIDVDTGHWCIIPIHSFPLRKFTISPVSYDQKNDTKLSKHCSVCLRKNTYAYVECRCSFRFSSQTKRKKVKVRICAVLSFLLFSKFIGRICTPKM